MITLNLKFDDEYKKVNIKEDIIFNAILSKHPDIIKTLIKDILPTYNISDAYFNIINRYVDFTPDNNAVYAGLIVRTNLSEYAVLYLENSTIDEEYMLSLIKEYISDTDSHVGSDVNVNKFEVDVNTFLNIVKKI